MKKIVFTILITATCLAVAGTNFKQVIIGEWDAVQSNSDGEVKYRIIIDKKNFTTVKNGVTETSKYTIAGDKLCLTGDASKCMMLVYASDDELYIPSENIRMTRVR